MSEINSSWAFSQNADEKRKTNIETYKELKEKYKIAHGTRIYNSETKQIEDINENDFDVIVSVESNGYAHTKYKVIKNEPNLNMRELALICDEGNLCFGYRVQNGMICIHTD